MIDFAALVNEIRDKQGYCTVAKSSYAAIDGIEIDCVTKVSKPVKVHWLCDQTSSGPVFVLLNGITGHERWYIKDLIEGGLLESEAENFWACAGTDNRWNGLYLNMSQVQKVIKMLKE